MSDERQSAMSEEFRARMRQGLSSMAVLERRRERRRNRAIAGGSAAAVAALVVGVGIWSVAGAELPERDQAAPTSPVEPGAAPSDPASEPTPSASPLPAPPTGFAGVAARQPITYASLPGCESECGDTGAAGGPLDDRVERVYDVYVVCEGQGSVSFGGERWLDCSALAPGTGYAALGLYDLVDDGDPRFTASSDFDGQLSVVDTGEPSTGSIDGATATVFVDCYPGSLPITIGGVVFECDPTLASQSLAAWGVPILPGEIAPRIEGTWSLRFVVER
jgi:hypothetical protein